jgi:ankyrin repeat protein
MYRASLIHLAARENNSDLVEILMRKGFGLNQRDYFGRTPLHYALSCNREEMVNYLLDAKANVMSMKGYSLLLAVENCSRDVVERIVKQMEALEDRFKPFQFTGIPMDSTVQIIKDLSLNAATIRGSREIAKLLLSYGAHPDWRNDSELSIDIFRRCSLGLVPPY